MARRRVICAVVVVAVCGVTSTASAAFDVCVVQANIEASGSMDIDLPAGFGTPTAYMTIMTTAFWGGTNPHHQARMGIGFSDGTTERALVVQSRDDRAPTDTYRWMSNTHSGITMNAGGAGARTTIETTSFSSDTITVNCDNYGGDMGVVFVVFTGTDDVWVGDYSHDGDSDDANGRASTTAPGFQPDVVFMVTNLTASAASGTSEAIFTFGAAVNDGSETQESYAFGSKDNVYGAKLNGAYWRSKMAKPVHNNATQEGISIYSFDANGFTTEIDDLSAGKSVDNSIVMALDLPSGEAADIVYTQVPSGTAPVDQVITSSLAFAPKAQIAVGALLPSANNRYDDIQASSFMISAGFNDGSETEYAQSYYDEDGLGTFVPNVPTDCWNEVNGDIFNMYDTSADNVAVTKSYDGSGVTWTWDPLSSTGDDFFVVFFSGKPAVSVLDYERSTRGLHRGIKVGGF